MSQSQRTCAACGEPVGAAEASLRVFGKQPNGERISFHALLHTDRACWTSFAAETAEVLERLYLEAHDPELAELEAIPVATPQKIGALRRKHHRDA